MFSSDTYPTLCLGIPTLEALHAGLTQKHCKVSERLHAPIDARLVKIVEYYDLTRASDAYLVSMGSNFCFYWLDI